MKALDYLYRMKQANEEMGYEPTNIIEAIKELEDIQNRKCDNCKYNKKQESFMVFCDKKAYPDGSVMGWHSFAKDFSCRFWESK